MKETESNPLANYLNNLEAEIEAEEEEISQAENLARERARMEAEDKQMKHLIEQALGGFAPRGHSNEWKVNEIAERLKSKGISGEENIKRTLLNMIHQARSRVTLKGLRDLDRVFLAIRGGSIR